MKNRNIILVTMAYLATVALGFGLFALFGWEYDSKSGLFGFLRFFIPMIVLYNLD